MRNKALILGATLAILAAGVGIFLQWAGENEGAASEGQESEMGAVYLSASWAIWYPNFEELMKDHELVVVGEVVDQHLEIVGSLGFPESHHQVYVRNVIKDTSGEVKQGDIIDVYQSGGLVIIDAQAHTCEFLDSPLLENGSVSVLFLNDRDDDGIWGGLGPQTRFVVKDGKVNSLDVAYPDRVGSSGGNLHREGEDLGSFIRMLEECKKTYTPEVLTHEALWIGRKLVTENAGVNAGILVGIELKKVKPNYFWSSHAPMEDVGGSGAENTLCYLVKFEQEENPGHFLEVWIDANSGEVVGGREY